MGYAHTMYRLLILSLTLSSCLTSGEWWYLGVVGPYQGSSTGVALAPKESRSKRAQPCEDMPFLSARQKELCNQGEFIVDVISEGAALGISECLIQFKDRRWNCSTFDSEDVFGRILDLDSREKSFVYSVSAAGVMHAITKACARGEIGNCGCDTSVYDIDTEDKFQWGGCSHNPEFGAKFAREFVDTKEARNDADGSMNLWNNEAGRQAVRKQMRTLCKCHGVSASCAVKICWRSLSGFNEVGDALKTAYDGAKQVRYVERKKALRPAIKRYARPQKEDLVYLKESPDFCKYNASIGSLGTVGRPCNRTSQGLDGCAMLCCGRGFHTEIRNVKLDCNCQFVWCCRVECETCEERKEFNYCR